ncbi:hypothetical protein BMF94_1774 [Rhodotorula taiwanensis]|uniref:UBC core domain-containing protein n=1 Tax=Rhodotorula taiwanensis TaxID=741276 RepID=A0A2S5BEH4_9BASI|nr:hypothetical protein BMF94_1774 [Rhodotorula taiwanensis]
MSTASRRRLMRDFKRLQSDPPGGISGAPCADNVMVWNAIIFGPGEPRNARFKIDPSLSMPEAYAGIHYLDERELGADAAAALLSSHSAPCFRHAPASHRLSAEIYLCRSLVHARSAETPFEDGTFRLVLTFDESYPNKPPVVKFLSKMFHPNVYANGELCLDILQNRWSPTYDVAAILTSIQSLLHDPNPNSPANVEAATLYRDNNREYVKRVRETVEQSWLDDDIPT